MRTLLLCGMLCLVVACSGKQPPRPVASAPEGMGCVIACAQVGATCNIGCGMAQPWWVGAMCAGGCQQRRLECEDTCAMAYPASFTYR